MKRLSLFLVAAMFILPSLVSALDTETRFVAPVHQWSAADLAHFDAEWLHPKLVEGSNVRFAERRFTDDSGLELSALNAALGNAGVLELRRTFGKDREILRAWKDAGEARSAHSGLD